MSYLEELLPEFRKGAKIRHINWGKNEYIYLGKDDIVYDEKNKVFEFSSVELLYQWELYQDPIDWDYIIKNKCLCWFWDIDEEEKRIAGILADYDSYNSQFGRYKGENIAVTYFDCCRPFHKNEVTFYEDRKDEDER